MICPVTSVDEVCSRHGRRHIGHTLAIALDPSEEAERFRKAWDGNTRPAQKMTKPILRPLSLVRVCTNNTGENGTTKAGCTKCTTYACKLKGTVKLSECFYCNEWEPPHHLRKTTTAGSIDNTYQSKEHIEKYTEQSRHLLFHIWPRKTHAGTWQRNLDQLKIRWPLFTGKRVIAVATSGDSHPFEAVQEYMHGYECEWIQVENKPELREVATFAQLFGSVENLPGYTFYGQAKGVTKPVNPGVSIHAWTTTMYEILLDYWPLVEEALKTHCTAGIFKKMVDGAFGGSRSTWHYSGSFCWFKNAELWKRNWRAIEQVWFGIESYPSMVFSREQAACLFYESTKQFDLYRLHNWQRVETELKQWRKDHQQYRTGIIK